MTLAVDDRFWSKVDKSGGPDACWIWKAALDRKGYGAFQVSGKVVKAHRFAYELVNGPIPDGLCGLHRCDNPGCCNPAHIFLGTRADNNADMVAKGRDNKAAGVRNGLAKLTDAKVMEIRRLFASGCATKAELGRRFEVTHTTICDVVAEKRWKTATPAPEGI